MKKRIYFSFLFLVLPCVLILSTALGLLFHNAAKKHEYEAVRDYAHLVSNLLNTGVSGEIGFSDYIGRDPGAPRMTVIAPDGTVLLDSRAVADTLENHAERPEIVEALQSGSGESLRYSDTLRTEMFYFAVMLDDGNILRMAKPVSAASQTFKMTLPTGVIVTALVLLVANFTAQRLTRRIIQPIENIDFGGENIAVYDELAPYMRKIDHQKSEIDEKLAALSERAETIEAITGNMKEGLILIDANGEALTANRSAREIFGNEAEHKSILQICRDLDFQSAVKQCLSGENAELKMERDGRVYSVFMSPVNSCGTARGAVILFHDVTEKHIAEKQRREFSANVSHELKTPLTTISALSEMIGNGIAKDIDIEIFTARISEQAGRLLALIEDIIRLSEFDEGGIAKENTVFDLYELAETVIGALRDNAGGIDIQLTGERFEISANRRMIDELLYNLITNGVKYNKEGGYVTVDLARIEDGTCRISVSDTGIGIADQHQPRLFERFYRVDSSRSKKTGGTGLGLSIVKHIAEHHGGGVELHSAEGEGTTVTCYIAQ